MLETLLGTLFGGAFRLAPEVLKWLDRRGERSHELVMVEKQYQLEQLKGQQEQKLAETQANETISVAELQALSEAVKAQGKQTGIKWVDALNSLVRPILAFQWLIFLWPAVTVVAFFTAVDHGVAVLDALNAAFGTEEKAMASSIASFWLMDRSIRRG